MQPIRPKQIRDLLGMSFAEFDRRHGWPTDTTKKAVYAWCERRDGFPGGQRAIVLLTLSRAIGTAASPSLAAHKAA
jgi:hypothetical protein